MAKRRAKLWLLPPGGLYYKAFVNASSSDGASWSKQSLELLHFLRLLDWPEWAGGGGSYAGYSAYI